MTNELLQEFEHYLANLSSQMDDFNPPDYLSGLKIVSCFTDHPERKNLLLENDNGHRYFCKFARGQYLPMLKAENESLSMGKFPFRPYIIDYREIGDAAFLIREYIEGTSLRELVEENGPLPLEQAVSIVRKICRSLASLHGAVPPIIHRDIKPSNIVMTAEGDCYFIDMGTVRRYQDGASTDTICMGSIDFAAPEQFGARQTDVRTDVYGIGMLLFFLLTGKHKAQEADMAKLPGKVSSIIRKCIDFNPDRRYGSISLVDKALAQLFPDRKLLLLKAWGTAASTLCLVLCSLLLLPKLLSPQPVEFSSPLLEQAVLQALGKPEGAAVFPEDLQQITHLYICGTAIFVNESAHDTNFHPHYINGAAVERGDISDISILKEMSSLQHLKLDYQDIYDISPLEGLPLVSVSLSGNPLSNIFALSDCSTLKSLDISDTNVRTLQPLKSCTGLTALECSYSPVDDLEPLDGLPIETLNICRTSVTDNEVLKTLPLVKLTCSDYTGETLQIIAQISTLRELTLYRCGITSLEQLSAFSQLTTLDVFDNPIQSFRGAATFTNLESLCMGMNELTDCSDAAELKSLKWLFLNSTTVPDYSFLNDLPQLEFLAVSEAECPRVLESVPEPWFKILY